MPDPVIVPEVPRQPPPDPVPSEQPPTPPAGPEVPAPGVPNAPPPVEDPEAEPLGIPAPQPDDVPDPGLSEPLEIPSSSPPEMPSEPQGPSETTMIDVWRGANPMRHHAATPTSKTADPNGQSRSKALEPMPAAA